MCTVGTYGFFGCTITEIPDAQNRGSSSAPTICFLNSFSNSPYTVEICTPAFSNSPPCSIDISPPPPSPPSLSFRFHGVVTNFAEDCGSNSFSSFSSFSHILFLNSSCHCCTHSFFSLRFSGKDVILC